MKSSTLILALITLLVCSCNFSSGTKKDLNTGLSVSHNGFTINNAYLVGSDNTPKGNNQVNIGDKVAIVIDGIENYELKDGKAFPGLSLTVTDKDGTAIISEADMLNNADGYSPTDAAIIRGTVTVGPPMRSTESYHAKMFVWDKNKPGKEITAEVDLVVQ